MTPWTALSVVIGVIALMFSIFLQLNSSIDKKIETKLKDPVFIKKVASEIRLPLLIFDEEKKYLTDIGASELIKDIKIIKDGRDIKEIIITPNKFLQIAPMLESYDSHIKFDEPQHGSQFDWVYKTILPEMIFAETYPSGKQPLKKFKLQIIELSK